MCLTVSPDFDSVGAGSPQNFPKLFSLSFEQKRKCKLNNSVSIHFNSGVSKWGGGGTLSLTLIHLLLHLPADAVSEKQHMGNCWCGVICWYSKCVPSKYPHSPGFLINQTLGWFRKPMPEEKSTYHWSAWKCWRYQLNLFSLVTTARVPWF